MANSVSQGLRDQQTVAPAGPPPLPKKTSYYLAVNNQQAGPFEAAVLSDKIAAGALTRETLIWSPGMANWIAAGSVAELASLFGNVPPPIPGKA
jgi:hypothetical protein